MHFWVVLRAGAGITRKGSHATGHRTSIPSSCLRPKLRRPWNESKDKPDKSESDSPTSVFGEHGNG